MIDNDLLKLKQEKLALLKEKARREAELPHLYLPMYFWQRNWFNSSNIYNFLTAANQVGKSSCNIRKAIHWATDKSIWPQLWTKAPTQFFYFYPGLTLATMEFENKWIPELLPNGSMKEDATYGWDAEYKNSNIHAIHFKSGVSIYFRSYGTDSQNLQASSPQAIFCDEELPVDLWPELNLRLTSCGGVKEGRGYWHMVFTATLGQEFWRKTIEGDQFPTALKMQISWWDCLVFDDGRKGLFSREKILAAEATLTKLQAQVRIYGKFAIADGLLVDAFNKELHYVEDPEPVPRDWLYFSGVDPGGGGTSHPGAIVFLAVAPNFKRGRVVKFWKGNSQQNTTAGDILKIYMEMRKGLDLVGEYYDYAAKDFSVLAHRAGVPMQRTDKSRDTGNSLVNTLFQLNVLTIDADSESSSLQLVEELERLTHAVVTHNKRKARDDGFDALRYGVIKIPWQLDGLSPEEEKQRILEAQKLVRGSEPIAALTDDFEDEIDLLNELMEA